MKIFDAYGYTFGVPDWVRWVAVDRDNTLYGYYEEPYIDETDNPEFEWVIDNITSKQDGKHFLRIHQTIDDEFFELKIADMNNDSLINGGDEWKKYIFLDQYPYESIPNLEKL